MKINGHFYYNELYGIGVLYDKYSGKIYKIPFEVAKKGRDFALSEDDEIKIDSILSDKPIRTIVENNKTLNHLRLMLTNKCNFACTYCYADEGSYGFTDEKTMSVDTAIDIVDWMYEKYDLIKQLSFFGGEPLLNTEVIITVCQYVHELYKNKKIESLPLFSMVTNGYLLNDKIVELFSEYNILPVISIDGPKTVHDKQRILKNGDGTFDIIYKNLKKLRKKMPFSVEATFTKNHDMENLSMKTVSEYFRKEFKVDRIVVNMTYAYKDGALAHLNELVSKQKFKYMDYFTDFFEREEFIYTDMLVRLIKTFQNPFYLNKFCDAGLTQYTVDWDGKILPCHMFVGHEDKVLGNIYELLNPTKIHELFQEKDIEQCADCPDKRFCQRCLLDIENNYFKCDNFREGIQTFYDNMLYLYTCKQDDYKRLVEGTKTYGERELIQEER